MTSTSTDTSRGQIRMAFRLARKHSDKLRHVKGIGWLVWTGTHWCEDVDDRPMRLAISTIEDARIAAALETDSDARRALWQDAQMCSSDSALNGVLNIARALRPLAVAAGALDQDPYLFNCRNGTLDLRTLELRKHNPEDLITKVAGCGYDPDATGMVFHKFLQEILPDHNVRDYVQRLIGYAMLGVVKEHILPMFIGAGRNGKGKLLTSVLSTFGDYGVTVAPTLLLERSGNSSTTDKVDLLGKRLAVCSETDEGMKFAAATVKALTGGEAIRARKLYKDNIEWMPSHTVIMMTNHLPKTDGSDSAMFERLRKVTFDQKFTGNRQDPSLGEKLAVELPVILRWAVEGYQKYAERGLIPPDRVVADTKRYQLDNDVRGKFLEECCVVLEHAKVRVADLYAAWQEWNRPDPVESVRLFSMKMEQDRGFRKGKHGGVMHFFGVGLRAEG